MNLNQFVNMVARTLMHRLVNMGVTKGVDMMTGSGRSEGSAAKPSPEAARKEKRAREAARQAQRAIRNLRRFGR